MPLTVEQEKALNEKAVNILGKIEAMSKEAGALIEEYNKSTELMHSQEHFDEYKNIITESNSLLSEQLPTIRSLGDKINAISEQVQNELGSAIEDSLSKTESTVMLINEHLDMLEEKSEEVEDYLIETQDTHDELLIEAKDLIIESRDDSISQSENFYDSIVENREEVNNLVAETTDVVNKIMDSFHERFDEEVLSNVNSKAESLTDKLDEVADIINVKIQDNYKLLVTDELVSPIKSYLDEFTDQVNQSIADLVEQEEADEEEVAGQRQELNVLLNELEVLTGPLLSALQGLIGMAGIAGISI